MSANPDTVEDRSDEYTSAPRRLSHPVPAEGEQGLYTQTWFPICLSDELLPGKLVGRDFLGICVRILVLTRAQTLSTDYMNAEEEVICG